MKIRTLILFAIAAFVLPVAAQAGTNLLSNPGFESGTSSWNKFGSPTTTSISHSGSLAAKVSGSNVMTQLVSVTAGKHYLLKQWMRGSNGNEIGRVQVNWYTSNYTFISVDWLKPKLTTSYKLFRLVATAPSNAAWAEVYVDADGGQGWIYVDDMSFWEADHLRHHCYWYAESDWFGKYMNEDPVSKFTNLIYLNVASFSGGWSNLSNFRNAVIKAKENGLQVIACLSSLFFDYPSSQWSSKLDLYINAISGYEYVIFANYLDEPDIHGWSSAQVQAAVQVIKNKSALADMPVMITYVFSSEQTVPSNVDIVGIDPYPTSSDRYNFEKTTFERLSKCRAATSKPIFFIGKAFDKHFNPTGTEYWYYEVAREDPQIIGLGWFMYADYPNNWEGARSYPAMTDAHEHIATLIFEENILANPGFESGANSWFTFGSGSIVDRGTDMVTNGGFESGESNWSKYGSPSVVSTAHSGTKAAKVDVGNGYIQQASVTAGHTYQLRQWMRGVGGGEYGRTQINWRTSANQFISADVFVLRMNTTYTEYTMTVTAPAGAARANIYVSGANSGQWIYVDDIRLLPSYSNVDGGLKAAKGNISNGYVQQVSIEANKGYRLAQWMRGVSGGEVGRVQVNWYTSNWSFISTNILTVSLTTGWVHKQENVTAPSGAAWAEIYVTSNSGGHWIIVDNLTFFRRN